MNPTSPLIPTGGARIFARAARAALQWRLLLLWTLCLLVPTAVLALPMWAMLGANLDYSVYSARLARELDLVAITDLLAAHGRHAAAFNNAATIALVLTLLLSPLLSGFVVTAARARGAVPGLRALVGGGLHEYPRMLRMLLWAVVPLGMAALAGGELLDAAERQREAAILPSEARWPALAAVLGLALLLMLAHASLDAGRAALALDRRRSSALKAWWSGCKMLARRPLASFALYLGLSALGLCAAALLTYARINLPYLGTAGVVGAFVLTQLAVLVLAWMRSARLFALVELARAEHP
ncbi:hypothetical protein [Massilia glaciei]|uniref:DUF4013 domain-containing protein n=1 Tax=Massilia glaciei TaxID=1524097 RepID=A0A2U2I468_9BURK|nr:hypothetical protein [Massilia glaciei]PWF54560.1 hypothetical protein C7C56_006360 [Massilia glaciei]